MDLMTPRHPVTAGQRLGLLCVGAGRDGTLSVARMIEELFHHEGHGRRVMHEYCAREFYQAFCDYRETRHERHLADICHMVDSCAYDAIVGNGYATILPSFAQRYGPQIVLVHLRRTDRAACIASLKKNCEMFPAAWGYYSSSPAAVVKRMAAFHFGEMTEREWNGLPLDMKVTWYYDKTHALVESCKGLFEHCLEIVTEDISTESTSRLIARLVLGTDDVVPMPVHLNAHRIDIANIPGDRRDKMQWLLGRLDLHRLAYDEVFAVEYFLEKFVAWTGYQISGAIKNISSSDAKGKSTEEIAATIGRAEHVLRERLRDIQALRGMLAERDPSEISQDGGGGQR